MDYDTARKMLTTERWRKVFPNDRMPRNIVEQITWMQMKAVSPTRRPLPSDFHVVWYAMIQELHRLADLHEHAAIRDLHENRSRSWSEVARALGGSASRQAVQQRWQRLVKQFETTIEQR